MKNLKIERSLLGIQTACTLLVALVLCPQPAIFGWDEKRLSSPFQEPFFDSFFGETMVASQQWIVVGEPNGQAAPSRQGALHVFDAATGTYRRSIKLKNRHPEDAFGSSLAVCGDLILAGTQPTFPNAGAYLFNARDGRLLHRFYASDQQPFSYSSMSVAMSGGIAAVGSFDSNGATRSSGAVYLFDLRTGELLRKLIAADGADHDAFGCSVAISGRLVLVGAKAKNFDSGAAYLFDAHTGAQLHQWIPANLPNEPPVSFMGRQVALHDHTAVVGQSVNTGIGKVVAFDCRTGAERYALVARTAGVEPQHPPAFAILGNRLLQNSGTVTGAITGSIDFFDAITGVYQSSITPFNPIFPSGPAQPGEPNHLLSHSFGRIFAVSEDRLVVSTQFLEAGIASAAAYLYPLPASVPSMQVVATQSPQPVTSDDPIQFRAESAPSLSAFGIVAFAAQQSAHPPVTGNATPGIWRENLGALDPVTAGLNTRRRKLSRPLISPAGQVVFAADWSPATRSAQQAFTLYGESEGARSPQILLEFGSALPGSPLSRVQSLLDVVQATSPTADTACLVGYAPGRGAPSSRVQTAALRLSGSSPFSLILKEGHPLPDPASTATLGRFTGGLALREDLLVCQSSYTLTLSSGRRSSRQVILGHHPDSAPTALAESSQEPVPGVFYQRLVGATPVGPSAALVNATLTGPMVGITNNQGLYVTGLGQLVRKGDFLLPNPKGDIKIRRIESSWPVPQGGVLLVARLIGHGVTTANDRALVLATPHHPHRVLLREGDFTTHSDQARIRVIQRIDVNSISGHYHVLASLSGRPSSNQALFTGQATDLPGAHLTAALVTPKMKLRKGTRVSSPADTPIRSLTFGTSTDRAGTGGKGLALSINSQGQSAVLIDFGRGLKQIRKVAP